MDRHERHEEPRPQPPIRDVKVTRRGFLRGTSSVALVAGVVAVSGACDPETDETAFRSGVQVPPPGAIDDPTPPPPENLPGGTLRFFTPKEAATVDALTSRIMPGDDGDPGAHEAGVIWYIDAALANGQGFNQPIYHMPPFAQSYEGDTPPAPSTTGGYETLYVPKDDFGRYGYQSALTPREMYRVGLASLDAYANKKAGKDFVDLSDAEQDAIIDDLAGTTGGGASELKTPGSDKPPKSPASSEFKEPSASDFFKMVRDDVVDGMFGDPAYGGNRDFIGWKLLDYPGAQRAYTPNDMRTEGNQREPQSLAELVPFHPGEKVNRYPIFPVSGSNINPHQH